MGEDKMSAVAVKKTNKFTAWREKFSAASGADKRRMISDLLFNNAMYIIIAIARLHTIISRLHIIKCRLYIHICFRYISVNCFFRYYGPKSDTSHCFPNKS